MIINRILNISIFLSFIIFFIYHINLTYLEYGDLGLEFKTSYMAFGSIPLLISLLIKIYISKFKNGFQKNDKSLETKVKITPKTKLSQEQIIPKLKSSEEKKFTQVKLSEYEIYETIGNEIKDNRKDISLWTKALSQAYGDKDKAEAIYIKLRYEIIKNN